MSKIAQQRLESRKRRHYRVRKKITGTPERPRLAVFRSNRHIAAQVIDDRSGRTLAAASTVERDLRMTLARTGNRDAASTVAVAPSRTPVSTVDADATVRPATSSITCA